MSNFDDEDFNLERSVTRLCTEMHFAREDIHDLKAHIKTLVSKEDLAYLRDYLHDIQNTIDLKITETKNGAEKQIVEVKSNLSSVQDDHSGFERMVWGGVISGLLGLAAGMFAIIMEFAFKK